jgi:cystathionine gamma-synthase
MTDLDQVRAVVSSGRTTLVWIETPSNPLINVVDIEAVAKLARSAGAIAVVDNTWGTPALQRPLALGADAVVHSATKYIGGHSDLMLGVVVLAEGSALEKPLRAIQKHKGTVPSPFDCWMALRGVQTLSLRMKTHCANALAVAKALSATSGVERVLYPGLPDDPGHETASRQMSDFGGMLSFIVSGGAEAALRFAGAVKIVTRATSLGGTHTLIEHRASIEGPETKAPPGLLRISVGLEHPDDIIDDLRNALDIACAG